MARSSFIVVAALLAGCGSPQTSAPINTGLAHAKAGDSTATPLPPPPAPSTAEPAPDWADQPKIDLRTIVDKPEEPARPSVNRIFATNEPQPPISEKDGPTHFPAADGSQVTVTVNPVQPDSVETIGNGPPAAPKSLEQRIDDAAVSLTDLLTQQALTGSLPWRSFVTLAALDTLHPGAMPKVITPENQDAGPLSADERQAIESLRTFFAGVAAIEPQASADQRAARMSDLADKLMDTRPMRITATALCSRVLGFGQYTQLPSTRFAQGRSVRAIVYTEIANFGHRPVGEADPAAASGDRWVVDVTQTLHVYHDPDGVLAWSRPEERITEPSRNRRHDFFLIHDITLPPTLTIGAYNLKVIMKDKVTGQQDEAIIPFQVVTEAQATGG